jgi:signal peptidase II
VRSRIYFFTIAFLVFVIDQLSKYAFFYVLSRGQITVISGFLYLTGISNTGAAFGMLPGHQISLIIVGAVVALAIVVLHFRTPASDRLTQVSLSFILGGSLGNLFDRLFRSYVYDFIRFPFWPAFNLADVFINLGIAMLLYRVFFIREARA